MRGIVGLALAALVFAVAIGCGKKGSTTATGPASTGLEGTWSVTGIEEGGNKATLAELAKIPEAEKTITATADTMTVTRDGKAAPATYKLNPAKTPNEIDITPTRADGTTETLYGIYKLEGDTLTICAVESAKPADRPKEFKTVAGGKATIMVLKKN